MALLAVEGIYQNGRVELAEIPSGVDRSRVMVVFLNDESEQKTLRPAEREARRQAAFAQMREGIDLGGPPHPEREELHERFQNPVVT
jgi:hypothetical protein